MSEVFGADREMTLAKELTKMHEVILDGSILEIITWLNDDELRQKGEFVIIITGSEVENIDEEFIKNILINLMTEMTKKEAVKLTHKITGFNKNQLYTWSLSNPLILYL
jgi:16S rRNA (cytidine1402-2'-O)-methyltransferase